MKNGFFPKDPVFVFYCSRRNPSILEKILKPPGMSYGMVIEYHKMAW